MKPIEKIWIVLSAIEHARKLKAKNKLARVDAKELNEFFESQEECHTILEMLEENMKAIKLHGNRPDFKTEAHYNIEITSKWRKVYREYQRSYKKFVSRNRSRDEVSNKSPVMKGVYGDKDAVYENRNALLKVKRVLDCINDKLIILSPTQNKLSISNEDILYKGDKLIKEDEVKLLLNKIIDEIALNLYVVNVSYSESEEVYDLSFDDKKIFREYRDFITTQYNIIEPIYQVYKEGGQVDFAARHEQKLEDEIDLINLKYDEELAKHYNDLIERGVFSSGARNQREGDIEKRKGIEIRNAIREFLIKLPHYNISSEERNGNKLKSSNSISIHYVYDNINREGRLTIEGFDEDVTFRKNIANVLNVFYNRKNLDKYFTYNDLSEEWGLRNSDELSKNVKKINARVAKYTKKVIDPLIYTDRQKHPLPNRYKWNDSVAE
ncbi:MAG: hypothetical protein HQ530_05650 [Parcubacteria group bacterium]|nr:hypothetical protein [Parcubacteria group bacterium]